MGALGYGRKLQEGEGLEQAFRGLLMGEGSQFCTESRRFLEGKLVGCFKINFTHFPVDLISSQFQFSS